MFRAKVAEKNATDALCPPSLVSESLAVVGIGDEPLIT
jgi:hypothetical protein